jgi:Domain of unknown function (DUF4082)
MNWTQILQRRILGARRKPARPRTLLRVEDLESRQAPAGVALDMDTSTSPTATGYVREKLVKYTTTNHIGWQSITGMSAVSRVYADALRRDFHAGKDATLLADLPNGVYDVVVGLGDPSKRRDLVSVWAEGTRLVADATTKAKQFLEVRGRVTVTDGQLTLRIADSGGSSPSFAVTYINATPVDPKAPSLWANTTTPAVVSSADVRAVELGIRFQATVNGFVTGIRFYKGKANTGTHSGSLWAADGTRLATAMFTNETAGG